MRKLKLVLCSLLLIALSACAATPAASSTIDAVGQRIGVQSGGLDRSFLIRVPERERGERLPVVIALHGVGGNAQDFEDWTRITDSVDKDRFIAVYPDGSPLRDDRLVWNAGGCCTSAGSRPANDLAFLTGILDALPAYGGDPSRVYVTGFSNGGMMTYRLACELGNRIAGIAVVAGALNVMPVVIIHGTADDTVPYNGGTTPTSQELGIQGVPNASVSDAVKFWAGRDGCAPTGRTTTSGSVRHERFNQCATAGRGIDVYTIDGGTHTWTTNDGELDMTDVVLDAFVRRAS
jgi:polyhydroxybutyrate depolymerase